MNWQNDRRGTTADGRQLALGDAMARIDYDRIAERYHAGRAVTLDRLDGWRQATEPYVRGHDLPLLDLGAGTGIWVTALCSWFAIPVVAVEPSAGMRAVAVGNGLPRGAVLVAGRAEAIPLRPATVSAVWISTVIHHVRDLAACRDELDRVLETGGAVLIRNSFPGRHEEIALFQYFGAAKRVAETFPTVDELTQLFAGQFQRRALIRVREPGPPSMRAFRDRVVATRSSDSALAPLSDEEFEVGLAAIDADIERKASPGPMGVDLLVFTKG